MTGYGVPPASSPTRQRPGQPPLPLFDLIGAGLGVLSFVWGFLNWYGEGSQSLKGYAVGSPAAAVIGLSLLAGAVAAAPLLDKAAKPTVVPAGASVAALLVTLGLLVGKGDGIDTKIGLILELITVLAQAGLFVFSWLQANGQVSGGAARPAVPGQQWGAPPQPPQQYGGYQGGPPPGYGQPPAPQGPPPQQQPPAYNPPQQQQPPAYHPPQQPPAYNPPPQQPGYGQPPAPQSPPQQPGYGQPPSNPYGQQR